MLFAFLPPPSRSVTTPACCGRGSAGAVVAEKNGWLSDTRTTASIVYGGGRATIVVVEVYRPGVTYAEAKRLGRRVLVAAGLL